MGGVSDPHRLRAFIAGKPPRLPFEQPAFALDAVHDLHVAGGACRRAQQPIVPIGSFLGITRVHQRQQREGGIAQPAIAVVPVPRTAELFRQRRGGRGDNAAGRSVSQRLQRNQRTHHEVAAIALIGAAAAPVEPEILGILQGLRGIDRIGEFQMRRTIGENEGHRLAFAHLEVGDRRHVLAAHFHRRPQHRHVRSADREQRPVFGTPDPGNVGAHAEADHKLHPHFHAAFDAAHQADDVGRLLARRHEVDDGHRAVFGLKLRLQDQRIVPVSARAAHYVFRRRNQPAAVLGRAEERRKTRVRIESRPAQPVDRAVKADESGGFAVPDQAVIFYSGHFILTG